VYDCNYTAGERYYKPVVESLDRRTRPGGRISSPDTFQTLRSQLAAEEAEIPTFRRQTSRLDEELDTEEPRRNTNSALLDEFDNIFENRSRAIRGERPRSMNIRTLEDEADQEFSSYLKRVRETKPARPTLEDEFEDEATPRGSKRRQVLDFQEKLLNSVGVKNSEVDKARLAIEEDPFFKKRTLRVTSEDDEEAPSMTKWTAMKRRSQLDGESEDFGSAAARARKTRSRLMDLDNEMEELAGRSAAREKRVAQLRALVKENETNAAEPIASGSRVIQRATIRAEKKTVTF
jgi:predicted  nucleic acid-binding Zn-ribbon protein